MKILGITLSMLVLLGVSPSFADNVDVDNAIKMHPDLSSFYEALANSGVQHELNPDASYTIFAPTNQAFARIQKKYPCFYKAECRARVAAIVRNHIVTGNVDILNMPEETGGFYSLGGRFINAGPSFRDEYTVDGDNVLNVAPFSSGTLYTINGVIANAQELATLGNAEYADISPRERTIVSRHTIPDPSCGAAGCPDSMSETTTITRTMVTP